MNSNPGIPLWFPFYFIGFWLLIGTLLAFVSGWRQLSTKYRGRKPSVGQVFYFASAEIGKAWFPGSYRNSLTFVIAADGFFVEPLLFRFLCPRLFIPWIMVKKVVKAEHWFYTNSYRIEITNSWVSFLVFGKLGTTILEAWTASLSSLETNRVS